MIKILTTAEDNVLRELDVIKEGAWVHLCDPNDEEIIRVRDELQIPEDFLRAALDEEEAARIESEEGVTLVIVDIPIVVPEGYSFLYETVPFGIILTEDNLVTICLEDSPIVEELQGKKFKGLDTCKKTRLVLQFLYKVSAKFLVYLRQIDKTTTQIERSLHKSMKNRRLLQMLKLEKSLVFFSTALKSNEMVLEKIQRGSMIRKYPDDKDLLEDVIIENKQAIEMCAIYRDILTGTTDAFASIISNNLNSVMKLLAAITIVLSVPTMFASFWGMNVNVPFGQNPFGFWIVLGISLSVSAIVAFILFKKKMF